jgi:hypothetical protein
MFSFGTRTYASQPNTLRCVREGFLPVHTSYGVVSSNDDEGDLLLAEGQTQGSMLNNTPKKPRLPALSETPAKQVRSYLR